MKCEHGCGTEVLLSESHCLVQLDGRVHRPEVCRDALKATLAASEAALKATRIEMATRDRVNIEWVRWGAAELEKMRVWEDVDDEWSERIEAAFPTRSGAHEQYATAMAMVGHRHSKGALVALVTWLLQEQAKLAAGRALVGEMAAQMRWALDAIRYPLPEEDPGHFCGSHGGCDSTCSDRAYHAADVRKAGALLARADEFCKGGG